MCHVTSKQHLLSLAGNFLAFTKRIEVSRSTKSKIRLHSDHSLIFRLRTNRWFSENQSEKVLHQFSWDMIWRRLSEVQAERLSSSFVEPKFDEGEKTETADNTSKGAGRSRPMLDTLLNMYLDCSASQCPLIGMSGESTEPTNEGGLSLKQIREEVDTFVFAGFDTTACALSWTVYLLASHPHQQAAVRQELRSVLRKRWPESADALRTANNRIDIDFDRSTLHELRLLEACIHESLRLFSPVPIILREINAPLALQEKDDAESLSPLIVPAPASCAILLQHHHLNEQLHSNAHNFDPGRFLHLNRRDGESIVDESFGRSTANAFDYIPFSAGPRNCIGKQFALMQLKIVLAQLLLAYELTTDLPLPLVKSSFELVQKPAHPLPVHIRPIAENRQTKFQ